MNVSNQVLEKRTHNSAVLILLKELRYENRPIELVGSASLQSQQFFSDYDFFSIINDSSHEKLHHNIANILKNVSLKPDYYPIELKVQYSDGTKEKFFPKRKAITFTLKPEKVDFIKFDMIIFSEGHFIEVSIIYKLKSEFSKEDYIKGLKEDMEKLENDGLYYKMLKRLFNIFRFKHNDVGMRQLTNFFNTPLGYLYQIKSNLEAIDQMKKVYKRNKDVAKKIKVNLSHLPAEYNAKTSTATIKQLKDKVNEDAKLYYLSMPMKEK